MVLPASTREWTATSAERRGSRIWMKPIPDQTEEKVIPVGECYRCHTVVEPMLRSVVRQDGRLAKPAIEAAKSGALTHVPERFEKDISPITEEIRDLYLPSAVVATDPGILSPIAGNLW